MKGVSPPTVAAAQWGVVERVEKREIAVVEKGLSGIFTLIMQWCDLKFKKNILIIRDEREFGTD